MSEKVFRILLYLYPSRFRREYGDEALQLFRDRTRDERGVRSSMRLWFDLIVDFAISIPREYGQRPLKVAVASAKRSDGTPTFFVFANAYPGGRPLLLGGLLSLVMLFSFPGLINTARNFGSARGSSFTCPKAHETQSGEPQRPSAESGQGIAQKPSNAEPALDALSRRRIIASAIASIQQHHADRVEAQKAANALLAHERQGDDDSATSPEEFARLGTKQMRDATGNRELELLYSLRAIPERPPGPPRPDFPSAYREEARRVNCGFQQVEVLQHDIGYLKLNAFADTSACQATATAAMAQLNNADALILDLRDNRGGFPSMVSLISAYLFDHPEYIYCPLENTTAESWTHSPVPGNKLANTPVYVLTSHRTISAAEQFAFNMKMLKRATLVGETTAGGAHAASLHSIGDNFYVATVDVSAINPYSQGDWNETGVDPDIKVSAPNALTAALKLAGKKLHMD